MADHFLAYAILATIIVVILTAIFYLQAKSKENADVPPPTDQQTRRVHGGNRAAANRNARNRLRAVLAQRRGEDLSEGNEDEDEEEEQHTDVAPSGDETDSDGREDTEDNVQQPKAKIGKKKAAKLEAKAERREQRLMEEREREEQRERDEIKAEEDKQKEEEEEAEEARLLEEERKLQEERELKEQEEYEKMKAAFTVDESGFDQAADDEQEKDLLKEFVAHIKREKVVVLEELAARFRLRTQAVINRVTDLQADGTLTGVLDDRGKFIYISPVELEDFAKFIRQRGRVTLSELAEASGTLISLQPDASVEA